MKDIIFGAAAIVGQGVLRKCLLDDEISSLLSVGSTATEIGNSKLRRVQSADLMDYEPIESWLAGFDAGFFCLGISSSRSKQACCILVGGTAIAQRGDEPIYLR